MDLNKKTTLVTPDPYHIPGYCGYVPQFKYHIGRTFGIQTNSLLTDPTIDSSGNGILASKKPASPSSVKTIELPDIGSIHNEKYIPQMVPGYTGYIPRQQLHFFGSRYANTSRCAIEDFHTERYRHKLLRDEIGTARFVTSDRGLKTPLAPVSAYPEPYPPMYKKTHSVSPFSLPICHPQKYFMSGYTGFVPKARKYLGEGYPIITRTALTEDAYESARLQKAKHTPVALNKQPQPLSSLPLLYMYGKGLMPHYTGHVPGERYKYGMTFGSSTQQAVSVIP